MSRRTTYSLVCALLLVGLTLSSAPAQAQPPLDRRVSLLTGLAFASQYDDETNLGSGVLIAAGATMMAAQKVRVEGELSVGRHERGGVDAGALEATGTPVVGTARAAWLFGSLTSRARVFVSGGLLLMHSRGEFRSQSFEPGPDGRPLPGPTVVQHWRITKPGWETGLGAELGGRGRITWRPELRFSATLGNASYTPGVDVLEIPITTFRGGLSVIW